MLDNITLNRAIWHVLDVRAIWVKEFASALANNAEVIGWTPKLSLAGCLQFRGPCTGAAETLNDPPLKTRSFWLQRGFGRPPLSRVHWIGKSISCGIRAAAQDRAVSILVATAPHYAGVCEQWKGPIVYYATDLFSAYGEPANRIISLERRICRAADLVCPNSQRIANHLVGKAGCRPQKIRIVPNATRASNLLPSPCTKPFELPPEVSDLRRPIAGVIGNLAANLDWALLLDVVSRTPWLSWLFVGPTQMPASDPVDCQARMKLMAWGARVRFTGSKPYGRLAEFARAIDVAVLPYKKREPTFSGSSTKFYEHLAACRPIVGTPSFYELLSKEPLITLTRTAAEMVDHIERLAERGFVDGHEHRRWVASQNETWEARSRSMMNAIRASGRDKKLDWKET